MLPNWAFQLTFITLFGTQFFIQIIAFPVERDFEDRNNHISKRFLKKALPILGGAAVGGIAVVGYNQFTKSPATITAPATSLNSVAGGPVGDPFQSTTGSPAGTELAGTELDGFDESLDAGLTSPVVKRDLLGKNTSKSAVTVRDLCLLPRDKTNHSVKSSFKRGIGAFTSIVAGSAVMNVFTGIFKGRRMAPVPEELSDEQTDVSQTSLEFPRDEYFLDDDKSD
ncbi:hypothetical protein GcM3_148014 [Golovinomyces cichoracearum]|uniref:Uncharacterized protein n=1 Tax=Golovinomyces cichoracearum TaxID=62708 RepID=A0A420HXX8_9PEZI|nr:hypothetical protein GcM3_148014 [Golovinomyces cichoracearum]